MDAQLSWPTYPRLVIQPETIILDTKDDVELFLSFCSTTEDAKEDNETAEKYIQDLITDIAMRKDAMYEVSYRAYEMVAYLIDTQFEHRAIALANAYEALATAIQKRLLLHNAYCGDLLQYHYLRRFGNDIVMTRIRI